MSFKDTTLIFADTKITDEFDAAVMMNWEAPIME